MDDDGERRRDTKGKRGNGEKSDRRGVGEARSVCFVSAGGEMIDDAVNDILLDRHLGGSIDNT